jgi:hypothetical protein
VRPYTSPSICYCDDCGTCGLCAARARHEAERRDASIRQACLVLGMIGVAVIIGELMELAEECHGYAPDWARDKWALTERLDELAAALRGGP